MSNLEYNTVIPSQVGVCLHGLNTTDEEFDKIAQTFKIVRADIAWSSGERKKGDYSNIKVFRPYMEKARKRGMMVIGILCYGNPIYTKDYLLPPITPEQQDAFVEFARQCAMAFNSKDGHNVIWEIQNEPEYRVGWDSPDGLANYVLLCEKTVAAIRSVDPFAGIATGGGIGVLPFFNEYHVALFGGRVTDGATAYSIHPYSLGEPETTIWDHANVVAMSRANPGSNPVPLISTEAGCSSYWYASNQEKTQARYAVRQYLVQFALGCPAMCYYDWKDDALKPGMKEQEAHFGLVHEDGAEKLSYLCVKAMVDILRGYRCVKILELGPIAYRLLFRNESTGELIVAAWTKNGLTSPLSLPIGSVYYDLHGVEQSTISASLDISEEPVYIKIDKKSIYGTLAELAWIAPVSVFAFGVPVNLDFNYRSATKAEISIDPGTIISHDWSSGTGTVRCSILPSSDSFVRMTFTIDGVTESLIAIATVTGGIDISGVSAPRDGLVSVGCVSRGPSRKVNLSVSGAKSNVTAESKKSVVKQKKSISYGSTPIGGVVSSGNSFSFCVDVRDKSGNLLRKTPERTFYKACLPPAMTLTKSGSSAGGTGALQYSNGDFRFTADYNDGWAYWACNHPLIGIPDGCTKIGMWIKGNSLRSKNMNVQVAWDNFTVNIYAAGLLYKWNLCYANYDEWTWVETSIVERLSPNYNGVYIPTPWKELNRYTQEIPIVGRKMEGPLIESRQQKAHQSDISFSDIFFLKDVE